jgi:hypothetical protein
MTTAIAIQQITAAGFLFGDEQEDIELIGTPSEQDSVTALAEAMYEHGVLGSVGAALTKVSSAGRRAVGSQVATIAHNLLDLDLADLVVAGWCKFADLTAAARRTLGAPGSSEVVELATHTITSTHSPSVEVLVDNTPVATVRFELSIKFTVKGLVATVRDGRLVSFQSGGCEVTGTLAAEGRQLATRTAGVQLPMLLRLGDGIPLLRGARQPTGARHVGRHAAPAALPARGDDPPDPPSGPRSRTPGPPRAM